MSFPHKFEVHLEKGFLFCTQCGMHHYLSHALREGCPYEPNSAQDDRSIGQYTYAMHSCMHCTKPYMVADTATRTLCTMNVCVCVCVCDLLYLRVNDELGHRKWTSKSLEISESEQESKKQCAYSGRCPNLVVSGRKMCGNHLEYHRQQTRMRRDLKRKRSFDDALCNNMLEDQLGDYRKIETEVRSRNKEDKEEAHMDMAAGFGKKPSTILNHYSKQLYQTLPALEALAIIYASSSKSELEHEDAPLESNKSPIANYD
jgi:hypothetical protein